MGAYSDTPKCRGSPKILRQRRVVRVSPIGRDGSEAVSSRPARPTARKTADLSPQEILERNAKERERVHAVNDQYQKLKGMIPYRTKGRRISKENIVKLTTQYIRDLRALIQDFDNGTLESSMWSTSPAQHSCLTTSASIASVNYSCNQPSATRDSCTRGLSGRQTSRSPDGCDQAWSSTSLPPEQATTSCNQSFSTCGSALRKTSLSPEQAMNSTNQASFLSPNPAAQSGCAPTQCNSTGSGAASKHVDNTFCFTAVNYGQYMNTPTGTNSSPNSSFGSSVTHSPGSDSSMDLTRAGFRLNLLCHQTTSPQHSEGDLNQQETSPSCLFAHRAVNAQHTLNAQNDIANSFDFNTGQNSIHWLSPEFDFICL